uniref:Lower collar protein n=1 Tax=Podoviridae sp. ct3lO13 TaxID=2826538 RepID=A0A8S5QRT3_9CAUD|nr:MAG TPA: Lower collar protein [Podoviridae sp. ct3lO13]
MSKYTTEVRFVCESMSGLESSTGADKVDEVISKSWNKIFTSKVKMFDENYREVICSKILKHYYLREICSEVVGIWKLWMNERLEMILPYYNKLYESARLKFDPLKDINYSRTYDKTGSDVGTGSRNTEGSNSGTGESTQTKTDKSKSTDKYADTPQGALDNVESGTYLTNARIVNEDDSSSLKGTNKSNGSYSDSENSSSSMNSTEKYVESIAGKMGTASYSKMLNEYRSTLLNIDAMVVDEFSDLFMQLW